MLATILAVVATWNAPWITIPAQGPDFDAKWIWAASAGGTAPSLQAGEVGTFTFEKRFSTTVYDPRSEVWVAADNHATVRLNGVELGKCDDYTKWSRFAVGDNVRVGENTLTVEATNDPGVPNGNPGGVIVQLGGVLHTDSTWACRDASGKARKVVELGDATIGPWNLEGIPVVPPAFRKEFDCPTTPKKAFLRVIGLGDYRLYVNGKEVSQDFMLQTWSQYDKALYWRDFDVTKLLRKGENVVGVLMGTSFWYVANPGEGRYAKFDAMPQFGKERPFLLSLELFAEGKSLLRTDKTWRWSQSPLTFSHVQGGEDFDARILGPNWSAPSYDDSRWTAAIATSKPKVELRPDITPPIQVRQTFKPTRTIEREEGRWSFDFGQNCSGVLEIEVEGRPGQRVLLRPSEVMTKEGDVQQLNLWGRSAHTVYTIGSTKPETYRWRFFYHGFRYAEAIGAVPVGKPNPDGLPVLRSIKLLHIAAANRIGGTFACSNTLFNQTHDLIDWAMRSNMVHVLSDCPHREKMGWQECAYLLAPSFSYRYDCGQWLRKLVADERDAQEPSGLMPTVAPRYLMLPNSSPYMFTVEWGASCVLLPWHMYEWYGDRQTLAASYAMMKAYVDFVERSSKGHIAPAGLGDWYDYGHGHGPGPSRFTPTDLTSTATQAMCIEALVKAARVLGKREDAARYQALWTEVSRAFLAKFYNANLHVTKNTGSPQAGASIALCANLIPETDREDVLSAILKDLESRGFQQTPGDVGHVYFVRALSQMGRSDVLEKVYSRTGVGSYGGILAKGLTALPETWDAITEGSNSLNHCMLGHVMEWYYGHVLGIRQAPGSVGWKHAWVQPHVGGMEWARGQTTTPKGVVRVEWRRKGVSVFLSVTIPKGMRATVAAPFTYRFEKSERLEVGPGVHQLEARILE